MARALVPVVIVGIIAIAIVAMVRYRRNPQAKFQQGIVSLVRDANEIFAEMLEPTGNAETMSFLTEEHKALVKQWKLKYRKVNNG